VALPLLLAGSLLSLLAGHFEHNAEIDAKYAAAEVSAGAILETQAGASSSAAAADEADAAALEADIARHGETAAAAEADAGEKATAIGGDEAAAATEAGEAAVVQEVPGVNVAADVVNGASILAEEAAAAGAAVVAAKDEVLASAEGLQGAADEDLAVEKSAEGAAAEEAAAAEKAGAKLAERSAAKEAATAAMFSLEAQICHLGSLLFQAPIAIGVIARWVLTAGWSTGQQAMAASSQSCGCALLSTGMLSKTTLALASAALLVNPWADMLLAAEAVSEVAASNEFSGLTQMAEKLEQSFAIKTGRRLVNGTIEEPSWTDGLKRYNPFGGKHQRHRNSVNMSSNTSATVREPPPPPQSVSARESVTAGLQAAVRRGVEVARPLLWSAIPASLLIVAVELTAGLGSLFASTGRGRGSSSCCASLSLCDAARQCLWRLGLIGALFMVSIFFAAELEPFARRVQDTPFGSFVVSIPLVLVALCAAALHGVQAQRHADPASYSPVDVAPDGSSPHSYSSFSRPKRFQDLDLLPMHAGDGIELDFGLGQRGGIAAWLGWLMMGLFTVVSFLFGVVLEAAEGPMFSWALGGSYKSVLLCGPWLTLMPWQQLLARARGCFAHWAAHSALIAVAGAAGLLALAVPTCMCLRRRCSPGRMDVRDQRLC